MSVVDFSDFTTEEFVLYWQGVISENEENVEICKVHVRRDDIDQIERNFYTFTLLNAKLEIRLANLFLNESEDEGTINMLIRTMESNYQEFIKPFEERYVDENPSLGAEQ